MSLDLERLEKVRRVGGKVIARCPACAEVGADKSCEHLWILDEGRGKFGCVVNPGLAGKAHRKRIFEFVGGQEDLRRSLPVHLPTNSAAKRKSAPRIPPLRKLTISEMACVARVRRWSLFAGLQLLTNRGLLWYADVWDAGQRWPAWIITDASRRNVQARRLDGGLWRGIGDKKAKSLPGAVASWPIGAAEIGERQIVVLCEGQPDFCAALFVAWWEGLPIDQIAPVCITGTGNSIDDESLRFFAGKRVRIAVHADVNGKGQEAAFKWSQQLYNAGATRVDGFDFASIALADGRPCKDLADYATKLHPFEDDCVDAFAVPSVFQGLSQKAVV